MHDGRIFVQIASYRDDELRKTIESCLKMAKSPERITFGIVHQYDDYTKDIIDDYRSDNRFRIHDMPWQEAKGAGLARHLCNGLYDGEEYTLQIDSHMRFSEGWDESLVGQWLDLGDQSAVFSAHPYDFSYDDDGNERLSKGTYTTAVPVIYKFHNHNVPILISRSIAATKGVVRKSYFVVGGFVFGPGRICREVPYDKDVAFMGEEVVYSLKLFTSGFTIYKPAELGIYHLYERPKQRRYWNDMTEEQEADLAKAYREMTERSLEMVVRIIEGQEPDRLGKKRTIEEFERYVGIDFKRRLIHPDMQNGIEPPVAKSVNWVDELMPEVDQEYVVNTEALAGRDYKLLHVFLYDKYNAKVWSGGINRSEIEGSASYTIKFESRMAPEKSEANLLTNEDTWARIEV